MEFLNRHNFDFGKPYRVGVPYISRQEAANIRSQGQEVFEDLPLKAEDSMLLNAVRGAIIAWLATPKDNDDRSLKLPPVGFQVGFPPSFNRYQMRLIYQIVRNEFGTKAVAMGKGDWMLIRDYDQEIENANKAAQDSFREKHVNANTEFRWLIEALAGGEFSQLDRSRFDPNAPNPSKAGEDSTAWESFVEDLQSKIKQKRRVLVGHNLFTDLVNLYKCFIGELPASVQEFQRRVHDLFPTIIDTKYLAQEPKEGLEYSPLEQLEWRLRGQTEPHVEVPSKYGNYEEEGNAHEAGYDSLMTAKVAIKLATRSLYKGMVGNRRPARQDIAKPKPGVDDSTGDEGYSTAPESVQGSDSMVETVKSSVASAISAPVTAVKSLLGAKASKSEPSLPLNANAAASNSESRNINRKHETQKPITKQKPVFWSDHSAVEVLRKAFSESPMLDVEEDKRSSKSSTSNARESKGGRHNLTSARFGRRSTAKKDKETWVPPQLISLNDSEDEGNDNEDEEAGSNLLEWPPVFMPPWEDSDGFWDRNGNKLRVNACNEGFCQLGRIPYSEKSF